MGKIIAFIVVLAIVASIMPNEIFAFFRRGDGDVIVLGGGFNPNGDRTAQALLLPSILAATSLGGGRRRGNFIFLGRRKRSIPDQNYKSDFTKISKQSNF